MSKFNELREINVNQYVEKKNGLSYLSWSWAVDTLLQHDPLAIWEFSEPIMFGETMMVMCEVTAFGKTMNMHLPVMDNRNQAIKNPDAVAVNKAMMRCLAKCIACFGIGLYIFSGEDLPDAKVDPIDTTDFENALLQAVDLEDLKNQFAHIYNLCRPDPEALKRINEAKENRKKELYQLHVKETSNG
jgi:hypothetical protein